MEITNAAERQMAREAAHTARRPDVPERPAPARAAEKPRPGEDRLTLSAEAAAKLKEQKQQEKQNASADAAFDMRQHLEESERAAKAQAEAADTVQKCITIAGRILSGDKVSQQDERFLAKNNSQLYMQSVMMRRQKEKPQKYKSITEEQVQNVPQTSGAGEAAPPVGEVAPPAPGEPPEGGEEGGEQAGK